MKNITLTEWEERVGSMAVEVAKRCPAVGIHPDEQGIHLRTEACTGTLELRVHGGEYMHPVVTLGGGRNLSGDLSLVEAGLFEYRSVLDGLHYLKAASASLRIYPDGVCPCDRCRTEGKVRGVECDDCKGEGKR
jgi:hypothetical protein